MAEDAEDAAVVGSKRHAPKGASPKRPTRSRQHQRKPEPKSRIAESEATPAVTAAQPRRASADKNLIHIANQLPKWSSAHQCLAMKFPGNRIRASSSKNVLLFRSCDLGDGYERGDSADAIMQLGKIAKGQFALDFRSPVSPLQAFGIALSSFGFQTE